MVAKSIARIFLQNAINLGLNWSSAPSIEAGEGDELELTADKVHQQAPPARPSTIVPLPPARQAIIDAGGLIPYTRKRLMEA